MDEFLLSGFDSLDEDEVESEEEAPKQKKKNDVNQKM